MSNKKQTAVDFLVKEISAILGPIKTTPMQNLLLADAISKAKELQKQQTIDAWDSAYWGDSHIMGEHYFTETYGGNNE